MKNIFWGMVILSLAACSSAEVDGSGASGGPLGEAVCATGESQGCVCDDGSQGTQTCLGNGTGFGDCVCALDPAPDGTDGPEQDAVQEDGGPVDEELCTSDAVCDDGLPCTIDVCQDDGCNNILPAGYCLIDDTCIDAGTPHPDNPCEACDPNAELYSWKAQHGDACDDGDACTVEDACDKDICRGEPLLCDDGLFCNGQETCDEVVGCVEGEPPAVDDGVSCTMDLCDEVTGQVTHEPNDDMCFPATACSAAACDPQVGCYDVPLPTCCGNGVLEPGEGCDDGNTVDGDGCDGLCAKEDEPPPPTEEAPCLPGETSVLANPGFESGFLPPWTTNLDTIAIVNTSLEGDWALEMEGNVALEQTFDPVPVSELTSAIFWTWHDIDDGPLMAMNWTYSDGTGGSQAIFTEDLDGWQPVDILALLDVTKELVSFRTHGYQGGSPLPDISRFDRFSFCRLEAPPTGEACSDGSISILVNPGFEDGQFAPWTSNGQPVITGLSFLGNHAAETLNNIHVAQTFEPVPVSQLNSASFWVWHEIDEGGIMSVDWDYSDGSTGHTFLGADALGDPLNDGWTHIDILEHMDPGKSLVRIETWGYSGGGGAPDIARFDGYEFCVGEGSVDCEPSCEGKMCGDDGCGGDCGECAEGPEACVDFQCICTPFCEEGWCGDDGCGSPCAECPDGESCMDGLCEPTPEPLVLCDDGTVSALHNPGFEDGSLEPWTSNGSPILTGSAYEGSGAAETLGNIHIAQAFAAVPVAQLVSAGFWVRHVIDEGGIMSVQWNYEDGTTGSTFYGSSELGDPLNDGWTHIDLMADLDPTKSITGITSWGYAGGGPDPDMVRFDAYTFCYLP